MKIATMCCIAVLALTAQAAAAEGITAYSAVIDSYVNVNVIPVEQTRMTNQDFCTLMTGSYCHPSSAEWVTIPNMLVPAPAETNVSE